ncbi:MAG: holin [Ruminococcaceae bacterium]|nr:holin [Oscillospiraceae bacterium]
MDFLNNYIVVVVLVICLCVGYIIKHAISTDKINRYIPLIMAVLGVILNIWINSFKITPEIILGGLISGLASTGMHQAFKEIIENPSK